MNSDALMRQTIVALDGMNADRALAIAKELNSIVWGFKVNDLIYSDFMIISQLKAYGKVFADVKLHDIPNTVKNSVSKLADKGADIITVHASGGVEMMQSAKEAAQKTKIIGVTLLTSSENNSVVKEKVISLTQDALRAGIDGVVCGGGEANDVRKLSGMESKIIIVPGVRPKRYQKADDQKRLSTPIEAIQNSADLIVVGRPITLSDNPKEAVQNLFRE